MKRLAILFIGTLIITALFSCTRSITHAPAKIHESFSAMYPEASDVEWEVELGKYTADFISGRHEMEAGFDKDGKWLWSKREILLTEVPEAVRNTANLYDEGIWDIENIEYIERASGNTEYYKVEYEKDYSEYVRIAYIHPDGTTIRYFN